MTADQAFDASRVSALACASAPSLSPDLAVQLAEEAWVHLREDGSLDASEVSRRLMAEHDSLGANECIAVATAAVTFCAEP